MICVMRITEAYPKSQGHFTWILQIKYHPERWTCRCESNISLVSTWSNIRQHKPSCIGRKDFVRISAIRPKEEKTIEEWLDVCHNVLADRIYSKQTSIFLRRMKDVKSNDDWTRRNIFLRNRNKKRTCLPMASNLHKFKFWGRDWQKSYPTLNLTSCRYHHYIIT